MQNKDYKHLARMIYELHTPTIAWIGHNCDQEDFAEIRKELGKNFDEDDDYGVDTWLDYIVDNIDEYCTHFLYSEVIEPIVFMDVSLNDDDIEEYCENEELHAVRQELREREIEPNF